MKHRQHLQIRSAQRGMTLVELMVSLTIGLFLLGAVAIIYINTSNASRSSSLESQMNEDASLALELLQQQVRLAGFSNIENASLNGTRRFQGRPVMGCDGGFTDNAGDALFSNLACNAAGAGPDALAVRYEATTLNSHDASGNPGNCAHEGILEWDASGAEGATVDSIRLADNRYYIANDNGTPSLWCRGRTGDPATPFGDAVALIPNIEDMQVEYAATALPVNGQPIPHQIAGYLNATDLVALTDSAGAAAGQNNWNRVAALRVCLVARSARPVPTGDNPVGTANPDGTTLVAGLGTYLDCNGVSRTVTDRFIRRAYVTTIQLRNTRPALPKDWDGSYSWTKLYED